METHSYQHILQNELTKRIERNQSYSLRSFAKSLNIGASALSEILSGKRKISVKKAVSLLQHLQLDPKSEMSFLESVKSTKARFKKTNDLANSKVIERQQLTLDAFTVISEWYHFAMMNLARIDQAKADTKWIASRLGITQIEAKLGLERLMRLELIEVEEGYMVRTEANLYVPDDVPSTAIRKFHKQVLSKAIDALEDVDVEERDISSLTFAIDTKDLDRAKQKIRKFRKAFANEFEAKQCDDVYQMSICLFPLTNRRKK